MMQHMYPFVVLQITAEPTFLDVNVHPTKMDVRFGNGDVIYHAVYEALTQAIAGKELIPNVEISEKGTTSAKRVGEKLEEKRADVASGSTLFGEKEKKAEGMTVSEPVFLEKRETGSSQPKECAGWNRDAGTDTQKPEEKICFESVGKKEPEPFEKKRQQEQMPPKEVKEPEEPYGEQQNLFEQKLLSKPARSEHRLIGQLFDTYWLIEYREQLYIIDQHAAHEKVLYERTMKSLKTREYTSQQISPPMILSLTPQEQVLLEENKKQLEQIGFEIESFGDTEYAVYAVPDNLFSIAKKELLLEMIGGLSQDLVLEKVASMSCKAAVKGRHKMSPQEADMLIDELLELENPYACPHGRPTIISMSKYELEKKFKRIL